MTPSEMFQALWPYYENLAPDERPDIAFMHEVSAKLDNNEIPSKQDEEHIVMLFGMSNVRPKGGV